MTIKQTIAQGVMFLFVTFWAFIIGFFYGVMWL